MTKPFDYIAVARRVINVEQAALEALERSFDADFIAVCELLKTLKGRVILTGVGKSGHVARKISATLASTGAPSLYVHPTEASHGDMGMITADDAVIALSRSGETKELADILAFCKRFSVPLIAMTGNRASSLGKAATHHMILPSADEACNITNAPTTSTTLQIAYGDALAVALLEAKGFTSSDFKTFHPGGALGAQLATVRDLMHADAAVPLVSEGAQMSDALIIMSEKGFGCVGALDGLGRLSGIVTDGDLRRHMSGDLTTKTVADIMTRGPKTAAPGELAADALRRMTAKDVKIMQLFVLDDEKPVGILHLHDCLRAGLA